MGRGRVHVRVAVVIRHVPADVVAGAAGVAVVVVLVVSAVVAVTVRP